MINDITPLPVQLSHALHVYSLPAHHGDPFDQLLIAQAQLENISQDKDGNSYKAIVAGTHNYTVKVELSFIRAKLEHGRRVFLTEENSAFFKAAKSVFPLA